MFRSTGSKIIVGMILLIFVFSFAICAFDLYLVHGIAGHLEDSHSPGFRCVGALSNFIPSGDRGSPSIILASYLSSFPPIIEPFLPILSYPIFRPPQTAKVFLQV